MLGIISSREPIRGEFARKILEKVHSLSTGELTSEDKKERDFLSESDPNISIEWK